MNATNEILVPHDSARPEAWLDYVSNQVKSLRFGVVQIVIHDARVVQIEKTEKIRLEKPDTI